MPGPASSFRRFGVSLVAGAWALACAGEPTAPPPRPWSGFFHPPAKPGSSITSSKQCECRACDPSNCCSAEHLENAATVPAACNESYEFSEECGITVQSCTPHCYSHVWRVPRQDSCSASRPLVCCG